ncbi:hypothetical protein ABZP36_009325 [Zizania latifolia]
MMHFGHCTALRQARALGDELIVGVVSDDEIIPNKGPPATPLHESIDYIIHGDDPCLLPDGTDAYVLAKKACRYKQIKRTEEVSTTDIFSHRHGQKIDDSGTRISHFLPTSRRIVRFSNSRGPGPDSRIVYIDGAFDLLHAGHVEAVGVDCRCQTSGGAAVPGFTRPTAWVRDSDQRESCDRRRKCTRESPDDWLTMIYGESGFRPMGGG